MSQPRVPVVRHFLKWTITSFSCFCGSHLSHHSSITIAAFPKHVLKLCQPKRKRQRSSSCVATLSFYISLLLQCHSHRVFWDVSKCFSYLSNLESHGCSSVSHLYYLSATREQNNLHAQFCVSVR